MTAQSRHAHVRRMTLVAAGALAAATTLGACSGGGSDSDGSDDRSTGGTALTVVGACSQLVGPRATLLDDALGAGDAVTENGGAQPDVDAAAAVKKDLSALVATSPRQLQGPGGVIVDYLDDPGAFDTAEGLSDKVTDAVTAIDTVCAQPAPAS